MKSIGLILLLSVIGLGCGKGDTTYVPDVAVNFSSPLSDPRLSKLTAAGGAVYVNGGVLGASGIVLYRTPSGVYVAYDRCSSYMPQNRCAVTLDDPSLTVTDPCSGSKFSLSDGSPVKAPATRSLKAYTVSISNNEIYVTN